MAKSGFVHCVLCGGLVLADSPWTIHGRNPHTWRRAWMHDTCAINALEELKSKPSCDPAYDSEYDRYIHTEDTV